MPRKFDTAVVTIGIDPGKNTHLVGLDARGEIVLREKVARTKIVSRLANVPPCLIGIEAGMGTHYVTREHSHGKPFSATEPAGERLRSTTRLPGASARRLSGSLLDCMSLHK
jgi:hypothetical protein